MRNRPREERVAAAYRRAAEICDEDVAINQAIGRHGLTLIEEIAARKEPGEPVNVLTHCNAGWLATVDCGTATAPIYVAHDKGMPLHVWVDETRPRNQGAALTAWELGQHGVPHTVIADNTGGHLMQHGMVDLVDRRHRPRHRAGRRLQQDRHLSEGARRARQRRAVLRGAAVADHRFHGARRRRRKSRSSSAAARRVATMTGRTADGRIETVQIVPDGSPVANYGFDVTPARLVTGLITERGVLKASREGWQRRFPSAREAGR